MVAGHQTLPWDSAVEALAEFPVIISTVPAKTPLFPSGLAERTLERRTEPLLLIDQAMPPGFDRPADATLVRYMGVDEVASLVDGSPAVAAEEAVMAAAGTAWLRLAAEDRVGKVIAAIVGHADRAVGEEVQRFAKKLPNGGDPEAVLHQLAHTVARRILHPTISYVGSTERGGEAAELFAEAFGVDSD
jgi:glutamyl-tRNA reductase